MSKNIRVYELARELGVESRRVLKVLQEDLNIDIQNHMSTINDQVADRIRAILQPAKAAEPKEGKAGGSPAKAAGTKAAGAAKTTGRRAAKGSGRTARPASGRKAEGQRTGTGGTAARGAGGTAARGAAGTTQAPGRSGQPGGQQRGATGQRPAGGPQGRRRRSRRRTAAARAGVEERRQAADTPSVSELILTGPLSVGELADSLRLPATRVIQTLMMRGIMANINQQLDTDTARMVAEEFDVDVIVEDEERAATALTTKEILEEGAGEELEPRAPVVTVMGHVDHGKTTLLDAIRQTHVSAGEAGGITQHIGASTVEWNGRPIVFLDTPGHEAFTSLRARGARVTDLAVLVVAADDGVMPQTVEAMNHARSADVPIIVAINKMDRPTAQPERVMQQLADHGLIPEDWGGDTVMVPVSALQGEGIDELLEMILLMADILELKADPNAPAVGTIIDAQLDRGRGPVATVLVQQGTLRVGDAYVAGTTWGRVRAMLDDKGRSLSEAGPSTPVEVLGFSDVPQAGDLLKVVADEREARDTAERLQLERRDDEPAAARVVSLEEFQRRAKAGDDQDLRVILKADVQGSLEALRPALERLGTDEVRVQVVHGAVGGITESDIMLASAAGAVVVGFNVRPNNAARKLAEAEHVEIRTYRVIYEVLDDMRKALEGLLAPEQREVVIGQVEVRKVFRIPGGGVVAGSYVTDGEVRRGAHVRVVRDGTLIHEGEIASLRRFKDDVRQVRAGYECGIGIDRFDDIKEGDILEVYVYEEVKRTLEG
ncbi:MAG TPA: translation initiation factor IF-2 [Sphingobacteriaceae bacterium]|nr:translation initiation factor IF-2 [Sphingobacteriaceae bacterium]